MSFLNRRRFLSAAGLTAAGVLTTRTVLPAHGATPAATGVFRHGIASGDPLPDAVLLWTRVTPTDEAAPGSGAGPTVDVGWEVATDSGFRNVTRSGTTPAGPQTDHTVKVDASGLDAGTTYWYRFTCQGETSAAARTRTAPAASGSPTGLRFGVVSCANYMGGFFSAYRHLAARTDLDAVLHLGDYLYEYGDGEYGPGPGIGRGHDPSGEMVTLSDYRRRHAQYKQDPDLQALHAVAPFIVTWDDHESANDAWSGGAENHTPGAEGDWTSRIAAARRAWGEWMPVREPDARRLYRRFAFGGLADLSLLDLRTYRSKQVGQTELGDVDDPARSITGDDQMRWLKDNLATTKARWRLVGNPVMIAPVVFPPLPDSIGRPLADVTGLLPPEGVPYNVDQWDGYTADRRELLSHLHDNGIDNTVFLTGDIHSSWAADVPLDAGTYPASPSVAAELVCTSVTSDNLDEITKSPPRTTSVAVEESIKTANRHVKMLEFDSHGYSLLEVTPERVQMDWVYISDRTDRNATARRAAGWQVEAGSNRVTPAPSPLAL
ncbi:alkaline phosphatase D family protein [Streptomyces meridianus]|uniref:Alkaline phosphatase D family protein n=1 Tax=Streptomyces meridianus TaxID=2938945 RepID=A0ABT0X2P1_9ACTN|nr:alkaline phosphatase D family protein [Streptomyces meridianus]MCM2576802.1 alkaline phosphatase D family protein [Streptomyces meridianus]